MADYWLRAVNCEQIQFPLHIFRLKKHMAGHFEHETALLTESGGTLCQCHRHEHQELLELCDHLFALHESDWRQTRALLRGKFVRLVRRHVANMDLAAVLFINTSGTKGAISAL